MNLGGRRWAELRVGGASQQGCHGKAQKKANAIAASLEARGKGKKSRHSDWTAPYLHCNGRDAEELRLVAVAAACGYPLAPFVIGNYQYGYQDNRDDDDDDLHDQFRIA